MQLCTTMAPYPHDRHDLRDSHDREQDLRGRGDEVYWLDRSDPPLCHHRLRADQRIREAVLNALTGFGDLDPSGIDVDVNNGEVTLTGTVDDQRDLDLAEDIAGCCAGVRHISNQLRIEGVPRA